MYIEQGYKSEFSFWKYLLIPGCFISLLCLNFLVIKNLNIDMDEVMKTEIETSNLK